jgi:hypothetical protein
MYSLKTLVRIQGSVYSVDRIVISEFIETEEQLEKIKFEENSTHVFSNNAQTFFCTEIEEAEIIEETVATPVREMITQFTLEILETIYPDVSEEIVEASEKEIIEN